MKIKNVLISRQMLLKRFKDDIFWMEMCNKGKVFAV